MTWIQNYLGIEAWRSFWEIAVFFVLLAVIYRLPKKKMSFALRVLTGTAAGLFYGLAVLALGSPASISGGDARWFELLGDLYIAMFRLLILPAVFVASVYFSIHTPGKPANPRLHACKRRINTGMLILSSLTGAVIGVIFGAGKPGGGMGGFEPGNGILNTARALLAVDQNRPAFSMVGSAVVVFLLGMLAGAAAKRMSGKYMDTVKPFLDVTEASFSVMTSMLKTVIGYKPVGAAAIMAGFTVAYGVEGILAVVRFLVILYLACGLMLFFQLLLAGAMGMNPFHFFLLALPAMKMAIKTRSGAACLKTAQEILSEQMHLKKEITDETAAYAIQSGMQGCAALFPSMAAVFVASMAGIPLTLELVTGIAAAVVMISYGITGLPGTATMSEFAVVMGTGMEGAASYLGPMIAVDPIADVPRTLINVTGCMINAIMAERRMRE